MTQLKDATARTPAPKARTTLKSILVHVEASPAASPRLHVAVDLARMFDAALLGLGAEMLQTYADPYGMLGGGLVVELQSIVEDNLKRSEETFRAKSAGLKAEWTAIETFPAAALARHARSADLIVAGGAPLGREGPYRAADVAELVMLSGRPVFVAPPKPAKFHGRAVVVAWKDTREARRALSDAMPFLKAADQVLVVECCDRGRLVDARVNIIDVVHHLRRHGVEAVGKAVAAKPERVSTELEIAARDLGADLIVAGAYGHSRLGEWAFGGVTYDLLSAPERFVLFSH